MYIEYAFLIIYTLLNIVISISAMKGYVRDQNTSFKLQDVHAFTAHWLAACDESTATGCFEQTKHLNQG